MRKRPAEIRSAGGDGYARRGGALIDRALALDPDRFANGAEQALAAVKEVKPQDAADPLMQAEAERLLAELKTIPSR